MIRIAFLLMCHKNAEQVNYLIDRLSTENRDFYVHVDSKSQIFDEIKWSEHVMPTKKRIDVRWGHVSQCDAEMAVMEAALKSGRTYDYYWLISGQDFPIKTNDQIDEFLNINKGSNFVEILDTTSRSHITKVKRNELYYPDWMISRRLLFKIMRKGYQVLTGGGRTVSLFKRKNSLGLNFRFGANWFCLTSECMAYIFNQFENKPEILTFFKNCLNPDECFVQTIVANSSFSESVRANLVYVDWSEQRPNPKNLGDADVDVLKASDKLIARKFETVSLGIDALSKNV